MRVTILTDASHCPDHKVAGYGYWIACERGRKPGGGPIKTKVASAELAEMMAICNAVYDALKHKLVEAGDEVLIQTDCMGAITSLSKSVYSKSVFLPASHVHICKVFYKLTQDLHIRFRHVKGHTGRKEPRYVANKMCDKRAKDAMFELRRSAIDNQNRASYTARPLTASK